MPLAGFYSADAVSNDTIEHTRPQFFTKENVLEAAFLFIAKYIFMAIITLKGVSKLSRFF